MPSDAFAQTRRPDGAVPIASARPLSVEGESCDARQMCSLEFNALPPTKVDRFAVGGAQTDAVRGRAAMTLVDLSACATVRAAAPSDESQPNSDTTNLQLQVEAAGLVGFAAAHGPLIAREPYAYGGEVDEVDPARPFEEPVGLWSSAAVMANLAVVMQECANGSLPPTAVPTVLGNMVRWRVDNPQTGSGFDLFTIARPLDADYGAWLGVPRFIRREETKGRINYAFILGDPEQDGNVEVSLASFDHEITASDYRLLSQALNLSAAVDREARERLLLDEETEAAGAGRGVSSRGSAAGAAAGTAGTTAAGADAASTADAAAGAGTAGAVGVDTDAGPTAGAASTADAAAGAAGTTAAAGAGTATAAGTTGAAANADAAANTTSTATNADTAASAVASTEDEGDYRLDTEELLGHAEPIGEDDLPQLASLVRALVAAHLGDAYVDVFSAGDATGYLSFRSYLSWLWYDFSCNLGAVRVKYCVRCGRAFSVTGRRGPEKNYCSNDCRDAAHNERVGTKRDELRRAFLKDGATVAELARTYYPEEQAATGKKRVVALLESWPALKHAVDKEIDEHGWHAPLFARCHAEGLNIVKLLTSKRRRQLKAARANGDPLK